MPPARASSRKPQKAPARKRTPSNEANRTGEWKKPDQLTVVVVDRLVTVLSNATPLATALAYCGVPASTFRDWRRRADKAAEIQPGRRNPTERRYVDAFARIDKAISETTVTATAIVRSSMLQGDDKRVALDAAKFHLNRREKEYQQTSRHELTGADGGAILTAQLDAAEAWQALVELGIVTDDTDE